MVDIIGVYRIGVLSGHERYVKGFGKDRNLTFDEFLIKENGQDVNKVYVDNDTDGEEEYNGC